MRPRVPKTKTTQVPKEKWDGYTTSTKGDVEDRMEKKEVIQRRKDYYEQLK